MGKRAGVLIRSVSKGIDLMVVLVLNEALPGVGWFVGLFYILISDGLWDGRSLGKLLTGLMAVGPKGAPCTLELSITRNATLALGILLWRLPLIGWLLFVAAVAFEFLMMLGSTTGSRLGDEFASTSVIEKTQRTGV